ncbi:unnamed protein product [Symbiodinium pilosum]|uniref:Uncharacterized protein n=1 Tax=Symbiodinium pilosum TaxID=2952 RepID=A0A812S9V5_SYMPI|nr:unnamed protein product [Symbiodinium pilosum]
MRSLSLFVGNLSWLLLFSFDGLLPKLRSKLAAPCCQLRLPFLCPKEFAEQHPTPPSCSQVPDRCCMQSSCIMFGPYFLPGVGECRADRGKTTCADLSTPFGGTGVCQCVEGVCASNGVCMGGGSFLGMHLPFSSRLYKDGDHLSVPAEDSGLPAGFSKSGSCWSFSNDHRNIIPKTEPHNPFLSSLCIPGVLGAPHFGKLSCQDRLH